MTASKRQDLFEIKGVVTESLPNRMFRVEAQEGPEQVIGNSVLCTLNGNMRRFHIRVLPGDMVLAEMSVYDLNRARITRRLRESDNEAAIGTESEPEVSTENSEKTEE